MGPSLECNHNHLIGHATSAALDVAVWYIGHFAGRVSCVHPLVNSIIYNFCVFWQRTHNSHESRNSVKITDCHQGKRSQSPKLNNHTFLGMVRLSTQETADFTSNTFIQLMKFFLFGATLAKGMF